MNSNFSNQVNPGGKDASCQKLEANVQQVLWEQYVKSGRQALRLKNFPEAQRILELSTEKVASEADWRYKESMRLLATAYFEGRNFSRAETVLRQLIEKQEASYGQSSPEVIESLSLLATVLERRNLFSEAANVLRKLMQDLPDKHGASYAVLRSRYEKNRRHDIDENANIVWRG